MLRPGASLAALNVKKIQCSSAVLYSRLLRPSQPKRGQGMENPLRHFSSVVVRMTEALLQGNTWNHLSSGTSNQAWLRPLRLVDMGKLMKAIRVEKDLEQPAVCRAGEQSGIAWDIMGCCPDVPGMCPSLPARSGLQLTCNTSTGGECQNSCNPRAC